MTATLADGTAGLGEVIFPATTGPGAAYGLDGVTATVRSHAYAFTAASDFSGTVPVTATDRATNVRGRAFTVERDATPPQVWVRAPAGVISGAFTVTWGAVDAQAGVAWYDLDVSVDGGPWQRVLTRTPITNYQYTNPPNTHVTFRVTATDHVSNAASALARTSVVRVTKYYYHGGARVALRTSGAGGSVVYWLHGDHLGSVSLVTDHASRVVAQQRFLPYGGVRYSEGTFPTDVGFTGHRGHPALGLVYMRARYYHSGLGRFVSADVVVPIPGNPQDWNRYTYVANNPLRSTDPSGHFIFNRPSWMYFVPGLNVYAYARDCATSISQAVEAYKAGERRVGVLALHATGTTDLLVRQAESVNRLNEDVRVVFSNAPLEERLPHAVHLGVWATGTAVQIVGAGQLAKAGIGTLRSTQLTGDAAAVRMGISYDSSLPPGCGSTDKFGNIIVSSRGTPLQQAQALNHEMVHRFFTPRGPLQGIRADFSMWAYRNSHLLRYTEEAIAESYAQMVTGGSLREGLMFPITHGYVDPWRLILEAIGVGGLLAGSAWAADRIND